MLVKSQVKYIQSLSQKKLRDEEGVFVAEGPKIINELLQAGNVAVKQLFAVETWVAQHRNTGQWPVVPVTPAELERISFLQTPNQVLGIFAKPVFTGSSTNSTLSILLHNIQDPGNMGTIVRCADWFGVRQIVCSADCVDVYNPKVVQSSMGSIARVQVTYEDLPAYLQQHRNIPVYAATLDGQPVYDLALREKTFLLIGNESKGIAPALLQQATHRVTIPRIGHAESLNAAVATGILLAEMVGRAQSI